jgi:hypothetical protein
VAVTDSDLARGCRDLIYAKLYSAVGASQALAHEAYDVTRREGVTKKHVEHAVSPNTSRRAITFAAFLRCVICSGCIWTLTETSSRKSDKHVQTAGIFLTEVFSKDMYVINPWFDSLVLQPEFNS